MLRTMVTVAAAMLLAVALLGGSPDLTGTWKINMQKSEFGNSNPPPDDLTFKVRSGEGGVFHVTQSAGGYTLEFRFSTDGKEQVNDTGGSTMKSTHRWEGDVLLGDYRYTRGDGSTVIQKDRVTYSADGRMMTMNRQIDDMKMKWVFERQ